MVSVATKDHIRLRQGFGGQEEHRENLFKILVTFRGKKSGKPTRPAAVCCERSTVFQQPLSLRAVRIQKKLVPMSED
jgi:hypothetical protein